MTAKQKIIITPEMVENWKPCPKYNLERLRELGGDGLTPSQIAKLDIPFADRMWVLTRPALWKNPERDLRLLACDFAEDALHIFEAKCPDDHRPRIAIETARKFAAGKCTREELAAAWDAAGAAALAAALAAAWDAAGDAAWEKYLQMTVRRLELHGIEERIEQ